MNPLIRLTSIVAFILGVSVCIGCKQEPEVYESFPPTQGAGGTAAQIKAPDFKLVDLDGKKLTLSEMKGNVVFIDFWATWCGPCIVAIPAVEELVKEFEGKKVKILSVSLDTNESHLRQFLKRYPMESRVAMAGNSKIDLKYRIAAIPAYYVISKDGFIERVWRGFSPTMAGDWKKEINRLLNA